jgi:hypothetical protein
MGIKYAVNESFFKHWHPRMAYLLGYLYADGSLEDASYLRGKYLRLTSTDKITVTRIREWLESEHRITSRKPENGYAVKTRYCLRIGSHKIYDDLIKLGMHPNKSLSMCFPSVQAQYLSHFLRGYLDGDGCVFLEKAKGITQEKIIKRLTIIFTSGSKKFLQELCNILHSTLQLRQTKVYNGWRSFQLRYGTVDSVELFKFIYADCNPNTYLQRKFERFNEYFTLRPRRIDSEIAKILKRHGHVK